MTAKKKIVAGVGGLTAICATVALTAGTFSYFSDSKSVPGGTGTVAMGTLKLNVLDGDGHAQQTFAVPNAAPGATVYTNDKGICFENTGSLNGVLRLKFVPTSTDADFNEAVMIQSGGFNTYPESAPLNSPISLAEAARLTKTGLNAKQVEGDNGQRDFDKIQCIPLTVSIASSAGNSVQGKSGGFTLQADLVQARDSDIYPADPSGPKFPAPAAPAAVNG